jgi:ribosomal protein S18 acetylase RimI-like enzyme
VTTDEVRLRDATADDFEGWFVLREAVAEEGRYIGTEAPLDRDVNRGIFERAIADENKACLLAVTADDDIVGALGLEIGGGIVHLGMWVSSDHRGRRVGRLLLQGCIDWARARGAHKVALEAWPHNDAAIRLYLGMGFALEGRLRRQWRRRDGSVWDAVAMGLVLDEDAPGCPYPDAPSLPSP